MKIVLIKSWLVISSFTSNGNNQYTYQLTEPLKNYSISFETDTKLPYDETYWIRMYGTIKCIEHSYVPCRYCPDFYYYICDSEDLKEISCETKETFIVNGVGFC